MCSIIVFEENGDEVLHTTNSEVLPRIGEKLKSNGFTFVVEDITYDYGYGVSYCGIKVRIDVRKV